MPAAPVRRRAPRRSRRMHGGRQRGAAIVTVLLIVTLATVVVSNLFWREHVAVRSVENRLALAQTRWIERGTIDYARMILAVDLGMTGEIDHLEEQWAKKIEPTRLDETATGGARLDDRSREPAMLAGQVHDAQGRLNLNNLVFNGTPDAKSIKTFERLLGQLGRPPALAEALVARLLQASAAPAAAGQPARRPTALPMKRLADLREVPGFDADTVLVLEPFAIFLPIEAGRTTINLNTARPELLLAGIEALGDNIARARQLEDQRQRRRGFRSLAEASAAMQSTNLNLSLAPDQWSVHTRYFLLSETIRFERVVSRTDTLLVRRSPTNVEVVWQDRY